MKKLLFAVSALAALSLLAPTTGFAEVNYMGLYFDQAGTVNEGSMAASSPTDVYLVMHNPWSLNFNAPVQNIGGVEFKLIPSAGILVLNTSYPVDVVDIGDNGNHAAGFGSALPVDASGATVVATFNVMALNTDPQYFNLAPNDIASIAGKMTYLDWDDTGDSIIGMIAPWDNFDYHVLAVNGVVPNEETTLDGIKALYR